MELRWVFCSSQIFLLLAFTLHYVPTGAIRYSYGPDPNWPDLKNYKVKGTNEAKHIKRILAFGDSLTEGYLHHGQKFYPYTTVLEKMLNDHSRSTRFEVINEGVSGECVFTEMATRLPQALKDYDQNLDIVIILGGTNDLRKLDCDKKINVAYELINLHKMVHEKGLKSVVVTIPEGDESDMTLSEYDYETYKKLWANVNEKLRNYARENKNITLLCDLAQDLPMFSLSDEDREKYWDDNLHPSKIGYEKMAKLLFNVLENEFELA